MVSSYGSEKHLSCLLSYFSTTESITGIHIPDKRTYIISASKRVMIYHFRRHQQQSYHEAQYSILYT